MKLYDTPRDDAVKNDLGFLIRCPYGKWLYAFKRQVDHGEKKHIRLRAQLGQMGYPIAGDKKIRRLRVFNRTIDKGHRIEKGSFLHCYSVSFSDVGLTTVR